MFANQKSRMHVAGDGCNKHMQRAGTHKVFGRGRSVPVLVQAPRARVLAGRRAGADVSR